MSAVRKEFGPPYGLVNNAGLGTAGVLAMMRDDQLEALVRLNTISPMILTKYVVRSMMSEKRGRIVNMASIVATTGYHGLSVYSATKASLIGFTRSLAREVGPLGITVNAVAPGFIATDMTEMLDCGGPRADPAAQRPAAPGGARGRGGRGRVSPERQGEEHYRHHAHGGCGQYRVSDLRRNAAISSSNAVRQRRRPPIISRRG